MNEKEGKKVLYIDYEDFYRKRKIVKILYQSSQEKRYFKRFVYSNDTMNLARKDAIWEYLNGDELIDLRKYLKY